MKTTGRERSPQSPGDIAPGALLLGLGSYVVWGFFPLYFKALDPAGALEVIVHRAFWGLIFCLFLIVFTRRIPNLKDLLRNRDTILRLSVAGGLIAINWSVYVYAVQTGRTVDAAIGYFINPLVTVALGMFVLHEKISRTQKVAVGLGAVAVLILVVGAGHLPWVSLTLAATFGTYSLVKKQVAHSVGPLEGMAIETAAITPFLGAYYLYLVATQGTSFTRIAETGQTSWGLHLALLLGAGVLTVIPLLLFAASARGLPLGVMGLLQYVNPVMQLLIGVLIFKEGMDMGRWVGTIIVWVALVILGFDWVRQIILARRKSTRLRP